MKVNDYVRTKNGNIFKIKKIDDELFLETFYYVSSDTFVTKDLILKSSPNIIDLIEDGDLLKIEEQKGIYTICEVEIFKEPYTNYEFLGVRLGNQPIARKLYELNIKSIVTKEQFESMEYRIGE